MHPLISEYIHLAEEHGESNFDGSARRGNKIHSKLMRTIAQIRKGDQNLKQEFYGLLQHHNVSVRIWTAVTLLKTFEQKSLEVLQHIGENEKSILGLNARTSIDCWNKSMLPDIENWNSD